MKILYNVTVIIDNNIADEWKKWMIDIHIPEVMEVGIFESYQMQRIIVDHNPDGETFAIQYLAPNIDKYNEYKDIYAPTLQQKFKDKYEGHFGVFRTLMEVVSSS